METESKMTFTWEIIDNLSENNDVIKSDPFSIDGCEWCICVYPKGNCVDDHLSVFLFAANPESLQPGWKRRANIRFVLLNQSGKELFRSAELCKLFSAEAPGWGYHRMLALTKLQEKGFLEENKLLTVEVYIKLVKVINEGKSTENEMVSVNGFYVLNTQAVLVSEIFAEHPDFAVDVITNIREVKTTYMNILLGLIETLSKSPQSLSETEVSNAEKKLIELTEAGFKLDWLKLKLDEVVYLERKKAVSDGSFVQVQLENVELTLSDVNVDKVDKEEIKKSAGAAKVSSFDFMDLLVKRCFLSCFSIPCLASQSQNTREVN